MPWGYNTETYSDLYLYLGTIPEADPVEFFQSRQMEGRFLNEEPLSRDSLISGLFEVNCHGFRGKVVLQ